MYSLSPASYARFRSIQIVQSIPAPFGLFARANRGFDTVAFQSLP
jgi:hypothetical protein